MNDDLKALIEKHLNRISNSNSPEREAVKRPIPLEVAQNIYFDFEDMECVENIAIAGFGLNGATEWDGWSKGEFETLVKDEIESARDRAALSDYIEHLEDFIESGYPHSYERDDDSELVDWMDVAHHESHKADFCECEQHVNGQYHASMYCPVYKVESSWRAGRMVTRALLEEYVETLKESL